MIITTIMIMMIKMITMVVVPDSKPSEASSGIILGQSCLCEILAFVLENARSLSRQLFIKLVILGTVLASVELN